MNGDVKQTNRKKTILWTVCVVLATVLVVLGSYLLYIVFGYYRVADNRPLTVEGNATAPAPVGEPLSLMTFNIGFGAYSRDYSFFMDGGEHARAYSKEAVLNNTAGAYGAVQEKNPAFLLLQEVDVDGTRSYHVDQTAYFAEHMTGYDRIFAQNYDSPYFLYPFHQPIGANQSGMMTFSRYGIERAVRRSLPIEESLNKYLDLDRAYTVSVIPTENGKNLFVYNVHLSAYTSDGGIATEQLRMLLSDMEARYKAGHYVIAAGDFNKDMLGDSSQYFERVEADLNWAKPFDFSLLPDGITAHSGQNTPTCRNADAAFRGDGTDFVLSVDGVLVSDNVELQVCETVDLGFANSDHNPVYVTFVLT